MRRRFGVISLYTITDFCLLYIGVSSVFPRLSGYLGGIDTVICVLLNLVLLSVVLTRTSKCFERGLDAILLIVFLIYSVGIPYIMGNSVIGNRYLGMLIFLVAPHIYMLYEQNGQTERLKKVSIIICVFAVITLLTTGVGLLTNPYLSRSIKSFGETTSAAKIAGIGGYEFVYFCMLLGVALFYCFWQTKKIWYLVGTVALFAFLLLSNYITAVFLLALGCALCLLSARSVKQRMIAFVVILLLLIGSDYLLENLAGIIQTISPTGRIARFIGSNNTGLLGGIAAEFLNDRLPTLQASLKTIGDSYGLGIVFSSNAQISLLGQHSFVLDSLAVFGIPMGLLYFYLIFKRLKMPVSCIVTFIALAVFNNLTNSIGIAVYFIIPIMTMNIMEKRSNLEVQNG